MTEAQNFSSPESNKLTQTVTVLISLTFSVPWLDPVPSHPLCYLLDTNQPSCVVYLLNQLNL